jgi:hypothetical protein
MDGSESSAIRLIALFESWDALDESWPEIEDPPVTPECIFPDES